MPSFVHFPRASMRTQLLLASSMRTQLLLASWLLLVFAAQVTAETKSITLPAKCSAFALQPGTGNLAATVPEKNEAWLFRVEDLLAGKTDPVAKMRVGSAPSAIVFKKFGDLELFAIVSSQDSHLYLMKAADGTLHKRIALADSGVVSITTSANPADPFLYYICGGDDSPQGVVNLRTMQQRTNADDDSTGIWFVSASGEVAYTRGGWISSGVHALQRKGGIADDWPRFVMRGNAERSNGRILPDPFDDCTVVGRSVFNRKLTQRSADLAFLPFCFFTSQPVIVGRDEKIEFIEQPSTTRGRRGRVEARVNLRAASYNSLATVGAPVVITLSSEETRDHERYEHEYDHGLPGTRKVEQMLADNKQRQVIYARGDTLHFIPLADFGIEEEPFLRATLTGSTQLIAGEPAKFKLQLADRVTKLAMESLPAGMKAEGHELTWQPTADQVGSTKFSVNVSFGDLQRTQTFELQVSRRSVPLPFRPTALEALASDGQLLIWQGPWRDAFGNIHRLEEAKTDVGSRVAVVNAKTGAVAADRKLAEPMQLVTLAGDFLAHFVPGSPRCEVLRLSDLQRQKSLVCGGPILSVEQLVAHDKRTLVVQLPKVVEVYSLPELEKLAVLPKAWEENDFDDHRNYDHREAAGVVRDGMLSVAGIARDAHLKPQLYFEPSLLRMSDGERGWSQRIQEERNEQQAARQYLERVPHRPDTQQVAFAVLPERRAAVILEERSGQHPGHEPAAEAELTLHLTGADPWRTTISRSAYEEQFNARGERVRPLLNVHGDNAHVVLDSQLYSVSLPKAAPVPPRMQFVQRQSALTLGGQGKTVLKHSVLGGKTPLQFEMETTSEGISIQADTGDVTIDEAVLLAEATKFAEKHLTENHFGGGDSLAAVFRRHAISQIAEATAVLGRKPSGFPVAVPIAVKVIDHDLVDNRLQYYVLVEVPSAPLAAKVKQLDEERLSRAKRAQQARPDVERFVPVGEPPPLPARDTDAVNRRIDGLEQRMDNITRQLNEILKKLDEKK